MSMSDKKMSGKQAVAGGFDLNSFVNGAETPENIASEAPNSSSKPLKPKSGHIPQMRKKRAHRPTQSFVDPSVKIYLCDCKSGSLRLSLKNLRKRLA